MHVIWSGTQCCVVHIILVESEYCLKYVTLLMQDSCFARTSCKCTSQGQCAFVLRHGCFMHIVLFCSRFVFQCYLILCYLMLHLYSLFVLIYSLLYAYIDLCLSVYFWLIPFHKSIPDLEIDPSRVAVKLSRATLGISTRHPSFTFGDSRDLRVQRQGSEWVAALPPLHPSTLMHVML